MSGPIGIVDMARHHSSNMQDGLTMAAIISISLGTFNCIPIFPLDGGRIADTMFKTWGLQEKTRATLQASGVALIVIMVITSLFSDAWHLFK